MLRGCEAGLERMEKMTANLGNVTTVQENY